MAGSNSLVASQRLGTARLLTSWRRKPDCFG